MQQVASGVESICASKQNGLCHDAKRFRAALSESGRLLSPAETDPWSVLEGDALRRHPDPLGALQRGEVPAVMLRGFVPLDEMRKVMSRLAQMTLRVFDCLFPPSLNLTGSIFRQKNSKRYRIRSNASDCVAFAKATGYALQRWPNWCTLLSSVVHDCSEGALASTTPECAALQKRHPVFDRCRRENGRRIPNRRRSRDEVDRATAKEFGFKLYGNLQNKARTDFLQGAAAIDAIHDMMALGCTDRFCSPKQIMLAGVRELAGPGRDTQQAREDDYAHSPGTVRAMTQGWLTPLHMDSKHSGTLVSLRKELCGQDVRLSLGTVPAAASKFEALSRHRFAASAILTMHAPDRTFDPYDLNIFRTRWPALLPNCTVQVVDAYGVGARFARDTMPRAVLERPLRVRADPGDLFLFNSEYFHDTPRIEGESGRTVFNSFAGYSAQERTVEVYA